MERAQRTSDPDNDPKTRNDRIEMTTSRIARASFDVYDLRSRAPSWSGEITDSDRNVESYTEPAPGSRGFWGFLERVLTKERSYPEPPSASNAVAAAFHELAKKLPKPKK